jgi:hypothetical protein
MFTMLEAQQRENREPHIDVFEHHWHVSGRRRRM